MMCMYQPQPPNSSPLFPLLYVYSRILLNHKKNEIGSFVEI